MVLKRHRGKFSELAKKVSMRTEKVNEEMRISEEKRKKELADCVNFCNIQDWNPSQIFNHIVYCSVFDLCF